MEALRLAIFGFVVFYCTMRGLSIQRRCPNCGMNGRRMETTLRGIAFSVIRCLKCGCLIRYDEVLDRRLLERVSLKAYFLSLGAAGLAMTASFGASILIAIAASVSLGDRALSVERDAARRAELKVMADGENFNRSVLAADTGDFSFVEGSRYEDSLFWLDRATRAFDVRVLAPGLAEFNRKLGNRPLEGADWIVAEKAVTAYDASLKNWDRAVAAGEARFGTAEGGPFANLREVRMTVILLARAVSARAVLEARRGQSRRALEDVRGLQVLAGLFRRSGALNDFGLAADLDCLAVRALFVIMSSRNWRDADKMLAPFASQDAVSAVYREERRARQLGVFRFVAAVQATPRNPFSSVLKASFVFDSKNPIFIDPVDVSIAVARAFLAQDGVPSEYRLLVPFDLASMLRAERRDFAGDERISPGSPADREAWLLAREYMNRGRYDFIGVAGTQSILIAEAAAIAAERFRAKVHRWPKNDDELRSGLGERLGSEFRARAHAAVMGGRPAIRVDSAASLKAKPSTWPLWSETR